LNRSKIPKTLKRYGYKRGKANAKTVVEASTIIKATTAESKAHADGAETEREEQRE